MHIHASSNNQPTHTFPTPRTALLCAALFLALHPSYAQPPGQSDTQSDTLHLQEITIESAPLRLTSSGTATIHRSVLSTSVHTLGDADFLAYIKGLGGISTTGSDYSAALSIDGADPGQTLYLLDGAPVFCPYHFGGVFSTFNPSHIRRAKLSHPSSQLQFFSPGQSPSRPTGEINAAMIAPSAAISLPLGKNISVAAAARLSLINELYPWLLRNIDSDTRYRFYDLNLSATIHNFSLSAFLNRDNLSFGSPSASQVGLKWGNSLLSARQIIPANNLTATLSAYFTHSSSATRASLLYSNASLQNTITQGAVKADISLTFLPLTTSLESAIIHADKTAARHTLSASYALRRGSWLLNPSLSLSLFSAPGLTRLYPLPSLQIQYASPWGIVSLTADIQRHFTHELRFADIGLASNFRILPSSTLPPASSWGASLGWSQSFASILNITLRTFARKVTGEADLDASLLAIMTDNYSPLDRVTPLNGFNAGISADIAWHWRSLALNASGHYIASQRLYQGRWTPSSWSIPLRASLRAALSLPPHWTLSAQFTASSGRPITPVATVYVIANQIIATYGTHNSRRLPPCRSLDIAATWSHKAHAVNMSCINILGLKNAEMQYFTINPDTQTYHLKNVYSIFRFLPSLNYTFKF